MTCDAGRTDKGSAPACMSVPRASRETNSRGSSAARATWPLGRRWDRGLSRPQPGLSVGEGLDVAELRLGRGDRRPRTEYSNASRVSAQPSEHADAVLTGPVSGGAVVGASPAGHLRIVAVLVSCALV